MDLSELLMVAFVATVVGVALYLPFSQWYKWRRDRGQTIAPGALGRPMPRRKIVWNVAAIAILFVGLNMRYLAPDTWLGELTQSREGRNLFFVITTCFMGAAYLGWFLFKTRRRKGSK